jgi:hypothetical protein
MPDPTDTVDSVRAANLRAAGGEAALVAATDDAMGKPAPVGELQQLLAALTSRVERAESWIDANDGPIRDVIAAGVTAADAIDPAAAPVLARVPALEKTLQAALTALQSHFGAGRVPGLPLVVPQPTLAK